MLDEKFTGFTGENFPGEPALEAKRAGITTAACHLNRDRPPKNAAEHRQGNIYVPESNTVWAGCDLSDWNPKENLV